MKNNIPKKYTMAVDIGTAKVAIMVGSPTPKGIDVAAHHIVKSHGVRNGVIQNVDDAVRSIRACLEVVKKQLAAKGITLADIRQVNAGIAGSHIQTETRPHTRVRPSRSRIDNKEIQEMTLQMSKIALKAGRHILHIIPQNYTVDDRNVACADIVGSTGSFIEGKYMIISADKEAVNQVQECIEQCGLKVSKFVFEPLASAEAVLTSEEKQLGVALVDIGGGTTDMIIYANNEIVSVHPLAHGGAMITDDIAQVCCLTSEQAEVLKVKHGAYLCTKENEDKRWRYAMGSNEKPREITMKTLAYIISARMGEILDVIKAHCDDSGIAINKFVLTGGGAELKALTEAASFFLGGEVRIGVPYIFADGSGTPVARRPAYATCVGLTYVKTHSQSEKVNTLWGKIENIMELMVKRLFNDKEMERAEV